MYFVKKNLKKNDYLLPALYTCTDDNCTIVPYKYLNIKARNTYTQQ